MARPRFKPIDEQRKTVRAAAGYGLRHEYICKLIGLRSAKTLRKYFAAELSAGAAEALAQVAQTAYQMATSGNHPAATMFWLKTRGGWRESGPESDPKKPEVPALIIAQEKDDESGTD